MALASPLSGPPRAPAADGTVGGRVSGYGLDGNDQY